MRIIPGFGARDQPCFSTVGMASLR
jgi:hypothetical protein